MYLYRVQAKKLPLDCDEDCEAGEVSEEDSADELDEDFKVITISQRSGRTKLVYFTMFTKILSNVQFTTFL